MDKLLNEHSCSCRASLTSALNRPTRCRCCVTPPTQSRSGSGNEASLRLEDYGLMPVQRGQDRQLIGTIDYAFNSWLDVHVGFRSMNFSYRDKRATLDMNMNGPILSATFHLT
jgi:hypothetical protein